MFDGSVVRDLRQQRNVSAQEVATHVGVSRSYINLIETGKRQPTTDCQKKLAKYFNVSLDKLCGPTEPKSKGNQPCDARTSAARSSKTTELWPVERDVQCDPQLSVSMVFGLVSGLLQEITHSVRRRQTLAMSKVMVGSIDLAGQMDSFHLVCTNEMVVLQVTTVDRYESWGNDVLRYCVSPEVVLKSEFSPNAAALYELVWFTEYASTFMKVLHCNRWLERGKCVEWLDPRLEAYID